MDRRCCCQKSPDCRYFEDRFDRPNSPDLGPNWDAPDWQVSSLKAVTSTGGLALCKVRHPVPDESMCVAIEYEIPDYSVRIRVIVNAVDEDNYLFADLCFADKKTKIGRRAGGVESIIREVSMGTTEILISGALISFSSTYLYAEIGTEVEFAADCASKVSKGYYCGLYADAGVQITRFQASQHNRTWHKYSTTNCCPSPCQCIEGVDSKGFEIWYCVPRTLLATFTDVQGDMAGTDIDGFSFTLENLWDAPWNGGSLWQIDPPWEGGFVWEAHFELCGGAWHVFLGCSGEYPYNCIDWVVRVVVTPPPYPEDKNLDEARGVVACSCDPLMWETGPFEVSDAGAPTKIYYCFSDDEGDKWGSFKIVITEAP